MIENQPIVTGVKYRIAQLNSYCKVFYAFLKKSDSALYRYMSDETTAYRRWNALLACLEMINALQIIALILIILYYHFNTLLYVFLLN